MLETAHARHQEIISYALKDQPEKGSLRETFFLNQLRNSKHQIHLAEEGDFLVDKKWAFEVGGKTKTDDQIKKPRMPFWLSMKLNIPIRIEYPYGCLDFYTEHYLLYCTRITIWQINHQNFPSSTSFKNCLYTCAEHNSPRNKKER